LASDGGGRSLSDLADEIVIAREMGRLGVGPRVLDALICDDMQNEQQLPVTQHLFKEKFPVSLKSKFDELKTNRALAIVSDFVNGLPYSELDEKQQCPAARALMKTLLKMVRSGQTNRDFGTDGNVIWTDNPKDQEMKATIVDWGDESPPLERSPSSIQEILDRYRRNLQHMFPSCPEVKSFGSSSRSRSRSRSR
jgi:hypothetical protein